MRARKLVNFLEEVSERALGKRGLHLLAERRAALYFDREDVTKLQRAHDRMKSLHSFQTEEEITQATFKAYKMRDRLTEQHSRQRIATVTNAAFQGDLATVKEFVEANEGAQDLMSSGGEPIICLAASNGHVKIVDYLRSKNANYMIGNQGGRNALDYLFNSSEYTAEDEPGRKKFPPEITAVLKGILTEGYPVDRKDQCGGFSLLSTAALSGMPATARLLLLFGANPSQRNNFGENAFDLAQSPGLSCDDTTEVLTTMSGAEREQAFKHLSLRCKILYGTGATL